jgi:hypothetical protein
MGEVHTGLLHHSTAVSPTMAGQLLDIVLGDRVRRSERPISYAVSPDLLTGVDCQLPAASGSKVRGVGTVVSHVTITGGHVLQGSAFVTVRRSTAARRLAWSYYLAMPGVVETLGKAKGKHLADGFLEGQSPAGQLDLDAIGRRAMNRIQDKRELDHRAPFRSARTTVRWVAIPAPSDDPSAPDHHGVAFAIQDETTRILRLPPSNRPIAAQVELCEDLALHEWLLTTLLSLIERSRIGAGSRSDVVDRLQPAIDYLLHLWMPAARVDPALADVWHGMERRPGLSRQWQVNVDRVRDQLALRTLERLGAGTPGL